MLYEENGKMIMISVEVSNLIFGMQNIKLVSDGVLQAELWILGNLY